MNKKISFPIAIIIIIVCAVLVGGIAVWQYGLIPEIGPSGPSLRPSEKEEIELTFEAIEKGVYSGYDESRYEGKTKYVINNNEDWQSLWNEVYSIQQPTSPLPTVDFSKDIVIAVFQGVQGSGGYSIEIIKIVETENSIKVFVRETSPGLSCEVTSALTQPYHIIKISKTDKEVIFQTEKKITVCEE